MTAATPPSLACRMLAAASAAYYITGSGAFTPPTNDPIYNAIGWSGTPTAVVGAPLENEDIDACLVGNTTDGLTVVAFRGTLLLSDPPTEEEILDWVQDILLEAPYSDSTVQSWGTGVMVHPGWWDSVVNITSGLNAALAKLSPTNLVFTGHSKGGPMATLAAMQYAKNTNPSGPKPAVYTYASPHPGNAAFATAFNAALTQTRYENYIDIAPLFPPTPDIVSKMQFYINLAQDFGKIDAIWASVLVGLLNGVSNWNYAAVGTGYYINQSGQVGPLDTETQWTDIKSAIEAGNYTGIAAAHCHSCPATNCAGGYMTGVCPSTGLCGS
jgi:hypothetical protein